MGHFHEFLPCGNLKPNNVFFCSPHKLINVKVYNLIEIAVSVVVDEQQTKHSDKVIKFDLFRKKIYSTDQGQKLQLCAVNTTYGYES